MNPYHYLESRFVSSQIALNKKQSTSGHAENHAILAWMWVVLKISTLYYLVRLVMQYLGVLLHLAEKPSPARSIALVEAERQMEAKKAAAKFATQVTNINAVSEPKGIV